MKARRMLQILAGRYAMMEGPMRRQLDAQTLLKMSAHLDEEGARVYLKQFVSKWRLDVQEATGEVARGDLEEIAAQRTQRRAASTTLVRRRPMTELELRVQQELAQDVRQEVTVTVEDEHGRVRAI